MYGWHRMGASQQSEGQRARPTHRQAVHPLANAVGIPGAARVLSAQGDGPLMLLAALRPVGGNEVEGSHAGRLQLQGLLQRIAWSAVQGA